MADGMNKYLTIFIAVTVPLFVIGLVWWYVAEITSANEATRKSILAWKEEYASDCADAGGHLPSGNILLCLTSDGRILEVDPITVISDGTNYKTMTQGNPGQCFRHNVKKGTDYWGPCK